MVYLALNIVFGSAFMLLLKWAQLRRRDDIVVVGAINYITAALLIFPVYMSQWAPLPTQARGSWLVEFSREQQAAIGSGVALGVCYFTAYFFVIRAVRWVGASSTAVVGVLSILLPISIGIFIWKEVPQQSQWLGMVLALVALLLIGWKRDQSHTTRPWFTPWILFGFFCLAGMSRLAQEIFKHTSQVEWRPMFLWFAFLTASLPSLWLLSRQQRWPTRSEWCLGMFLGLSNILQTLFILQALQSYPGFVVFPISSAGGLVTTSLVAMGWLHERPDRMTLVGMGLAVVAILFLN